MNALPILIDYLYSFIVGLDDVNKLPTLKDTVDFSNEAGIKRSAVSYMIKTGFIPAKKVQGRYFIQYRSMVESFIKTQSSGDVVLNPDKLAFDNA